MFKFLVPESFFLVADHNSIKMVTQATHDAPAAMATVIQTNMYSTSYSALTYDPASATIYFSDVNRYVNFQYINTTYHIFHICKKPA